MPQGSKVIVNIYLIFNPINPHLLGSNHIQVILLVVHLMFSSVIGEHIKLKLSKSIPPFNLKILINLILGEALAVRARGMGSKSWRLLCYVIFEWPLGIILKWRYTIFDFLTPLSFPSIIPLCYWVEKSITSTFVTQFMNAPCFQPTKGTDYFESNCAVNPVGMCQFRPVKGRILKTVDSVYQNVKTIEDCRQKCVEANYRYRQTMFIGGRDQVLVNRGPALSFVDKVRL